MTNAEYKDIKRRIHLKEHGEISLRPSFQNSRMSIEITNACNHHCIFCPAGDLNRQRRFIDENLYYRLVKEGYDLGIRELALHILGEPLLNNNIDKYIAYSKELGYDYVYLTTNGVLATPEKVRQIIEAGLDSIKFSINAGTQESYLAVHGKDDFETVKANLISCNEYRRSSHRKFNIFISFVVTKRTLPEVGEFKKVFSGFADDIVFYSAVDRGGNISEEVYLPQSNVDKEKCEPHNLFCVQAFNAVCITSEGFLLPCCADGDLNLIMANLNDVTLEEALYSDKMTSFREMHMSKNFEGTHCEKRLRSGSEWIKILDI